MRTWAAMIAGIVVAGAFGTPGQGHDWYTGLRSPLNGISCCNSRDCRPVDPCRLQDGRTGVAAMGGCWPIEYDKVLGMPSPDGNYHACWRRINDPVAGPRPEFICFVLGGGF